MARISIPESVQPGFLLISKMASTDVEFLIDVLKSVKRDEELIDIEEKLTSVFKNDSRIILKTILSFSGLLRDNATPEEVSKNLTESFIEINKGSLPTKTRIGLEKNLLSILFNVYNLRKNINSRRSSTDNESILQSSKLITDIRVIFQDDDLTSKDKDAIIMHKLHIEYQNNFDDKEIYLTLDLKDLNKLKSQIEKAIEKDQILREDLKDSLNIIF